MNDYLLKILTDHIVSSLPQKQRNLYNYVIKMEDDMAEEVDSAGAFMNRLKIEAPHKHAAEQLELPLFELLQVLKETEEEIARQLPLKMDAVKWIDCTDFVHAQLNVREDQKVYFLSIPHS